MSNIIDKIQLSGTNYDIQDSNAAKVVEITQENYDLLPTSAKTANIMYVITDATPIDVSNYYTKSETSGATELATAFAATQPKLSAGTNITIDANNVISAEGGGSITIDPSLDKNSSNAVANSAITTAFNSCLTDETYWDMVGTPRKNVPLRLKRYGISGYKDIKIDLGSNLVYGSEGVQTLSVSGVVETSAITTSVTSSSTDSQIPSAKAVYDAIQEGGGGGIDSGTVQTMIDESISGKADTSSLATVATSGSYDDLTNKPTIPTVPTSNTAFTNDAGYITSSALDGYATQTWVGQQGYLTQHQDISGKQDVSGMTAYTEVSAFTAHTSDANIHVTTAQTAAWNNKSDFSGSYNDLTDKPTIPTVPTNVSDFVNDAGYVTSTAVTQSINEAVSGKADSADIVDITGFAIQNSNTLVMTREKNGTTIVPLTVVKAGNGLTVTTDAMANKAFDVDTTVIQEKLVSGTNIKTINNQSLLGSGNIDIQGGGGGSSYTAGTGIDITNDVISVNSGVVTTNKAQDITGNKTFIGSTNTNQKPIIFKQANNSHKIGFSCQNTASTNNELATFEFRPDTYTDSSSVKHPLLYLGHYRTTAIANNGIAQTMVGFRQYDQSNSAAYHYLMPLPADAKTPFSLTTSFKNYFAPLGFKNGDTMITTDNTGVVDLSSELGGLKLVKLSQSEYDNLATKDNSTLYVIVN